MILLEANCADGKGKTVYTTSFDQIADRFISRVHAAVWGNLATIDKQGHPRSRLLHSIWDASTGYIATRRHSPKARDIAHSPYVSLAYVADVVHPVYVDCVAGWADDEASKQHVWNLFLNAPAPLGYDPAAIFGAVDDPDFGVLRLTPLRIELGDVSGTGERRIVWHAPSLERSAIGV
jgi:general stress protein 26